MVTLQDIAERAGISRATVSLVLNNRGRALRISAATTRRILALADEMGYCRNEIARSVVTGRTNVIGFLAQWTSTQHCALLLEGVMLAANRHRLMVKVMSLGFARSIQALVDICRGYRLAGLIAYELFDPAVLGDLRQRLARHGIPVVIAAGGPDAERIGPGVVADNLQGGRLALEHLAERGHRRVFVLSNYSGKRWADERCRGFENAAREAGLALSPLYLAGYRLPGAREIAARICAARATGVFCVSDYAALAVVGSLQRAGRRVPEDVAVIGYGNLPFCKSARPALSSVDEHLGRIGGRAVDLLIQTLKAGPQDRAAPAEICPVTLVPRDSTRGRRTPAAATGGRPAAAG